MKAIRELSHTLLGDGDPGYHLWVDIVFLSLFGLQIAFNLYSLQKQIRDYISEKRRRSSDVGTSGNG